MAGLFTAFLNPNVKPKYKIKKNYNDTITPAVASLVGNIIRDTAVSAGQIVNESANQGGGGAIFGKDYLSKAFGAINEDAGRSMRGEVTPMDIANVASVIPNPAGAAVKSASALARVLARSAPKITKFEELGALAGGGASTRNPINIIDKVKDYFPNETGFKAGTQVGVTGGPNIVRLSGDRAEGVYSGYQPTTSDKPGRIARALNTDGAYKRYGELAAGFGQKEGRGEKAAQLKPFKEEIKRILDEGSAGKKADDVINNMGLKELLETSWYKRLSKEEKAKKDAIQAHHYPGKDMEALSRLFNSYGTMDRMEILRQPKVRDFIADMHKSMAYGSGESNRLAREAHTIARKNNINLETPQQELDYMIELANSGNKVFAKYKGYTAKRLADSIGYPVNWIS